MKRAAKTFSILGLAFMLGASFVAGAPGAAQEKPERPLSCLTEEQRDDVRTKIEEMRAHGADREEIRDAVKKMLEGYGIDHPERFGRGPHGRAFLSRLTEEQRKAVEGKVKAMRESGAAREEIHAEVSEMLKGYGVEMPEGRGAFRGHQAVLSRLTEEQRLSVRKKIGKMREAGKSREEIHAQVREMLRGYGVEVPDRPRKGERHGARMAGLSGEQRKAVREKVKAMREAGASREEIRSAVSGMLKEYGVEPSQGSGQMLGGRGSGVPRLEAQSHPNPGNSEINIAYILPAATDVRIQIYNTSGQLVRSYDMGEQGPGRHSVQWDGRSDDGKTASSGLYLYRIEAGSETVTNCMVLLK